MAATITPPRPARCTTHPGHYQAGCTPCRRWTVWYNQRRRTLRRTNQWEPMVPAANVRAHIVRLREAGMTGVQIAHTAGLNDCHITAISRGRINRVTPGTADAILGVTANAKTKPTYLIDITGTRRRIRALQAIGWPIRDIATQLGVSPTLPGKWLEHSHTTTATADRVRTVYDTLSMTPGPSVVTRRRAAAAGWAPPLAWDDDTIDNPNGLPDYGTRDPHLVDPVLVARVVAGHRATASLTFPERVAAVAKLTDNGAGLSTISAHVGIHERSAGRIRQHILRDKQHVAA